MKNFRPKVGDLIKVNGSRVFSKVYYGLVIEYRKPKQYTIIKKRRELQLWFYDLHDCKKYFVDADKLEHFVEIISSL